MEGEDLPFGSSSWPVRSPFSLLVALWRVEDSDEQFTAKRVQTLSWGLRILTFKFLCTLILDASQGQAVRL